MDEDRYSNCIIELDEMISEYGLPVVKWSLYNEDILEWDNPIDFQFIIGKPPYIAYRFIDEDNRRKLKEKYSTCSKGKFDYCYAFIKSAIQMLAAEGKLIQLIPSNIYKNVFANDLRKLLLPQIVSVWEYPDRKIFGSTLTSSSIFLFNKKCTSNSLEYRNVTENNSFSILKDREGFVRFGNRFHA